MEQEIKTVTLANLHEGAAEELFGAAFMNVLDNIADPNTDHRVKREITLKVTLKPTDEDRRQAVIALEVKTKMAPVKPVANFIQLGRNKGVPVAVEALKQTEMFREPAGKPSGVVTGGAH